jgi:hypothetical protein
MQSDPQPPLAVFLYQTHRIMHVFRKAFCEEPPEEQHAYDADFHTVGCGVFDDHEGYQTTKEHFHLMALIFFHVQTIAKTIITR